MALAGERISPALTVGPVHLTVRDLERSRAFYSDEVGLDARGATDGELRLGTSERELLVLHEEPGAAPTVPSTGLFHFALLVPERADLARWLHHARDAGVRLTGVSDHAVSEAVYLRDPDGHGIEIYRDRPRDSWEGRVAELMTTAPLDLEDLMRESDPGEGGFSGLPPQTVMGHVHLKVSALPGAIDFYRDGLGFEVMAGLGPSAAFFGAGGYHHHLAANTWESAGAGPPPPGSAALRRVTLLVDDEDEVRRVAERLAGRGFEPEAEGASVAVSDPSGNPIVVETP